MQSSAEGGGAGSEVRRRLPASGRACRGTWDRLQDADKYINQALRYLDGMTERERYSTRGMYYRMTGDYQQCVKEYGELIARYAADVVGHNQRALCLTQLRDMRRAVDEMRQVVEHAAQSRDLPRQPGALRELRGRLPDRRNRKRGRSRSRTRMRMLAARVCPDWVRASCRKRRQTYQKLGDDRRARRLVRGVRSWRPGGAWKAVSADAVRILSEGAARGPGVQEYRSRRREVRGAWPMRSSSRGRNGAADRRRRKGADQQQGREDPVPGGARSSSRRTRLERGPAADRRASPRSCRPSRRRTPRSSKGRSPSKAATRAWRSSC